MKNLDLTEQERLKFAQKMKEAAEKNDAEGFANAFSDMAGAIQQNILTEASKAIEEAVQKNDTSILASRGIRQLTSEERAYYTKLSEAMRSNNPKLALTELAEVLPKTVVNAVFDDLITEHPLLEAINFQNTSGLVEILVNTNENQLAAWGPLCGEITKELEGGFKKISLTLHKLSAFIPVCKAMLDLGPEWLDRYVRAVLAEASAFGLEEGIINGTGKDQPIGMNRQVGAGVTVTDGVYPEKTPVKVTDFSPAAYGSLIAGMAKNENGKYRVIEEVLLIVNPVDYLSKVMPATTIRNTAGQYVNNVLPFPTRVVQSVQMPEGRAILGFGRRYFMGIGTEKSGRIEFSDEFRFLEDERVYKVKLYGHGKPLDNNAFVYLDISGVTPMALEVTVRNGDGTAAAAGRSKVTA